MSSPLASSQSQTITNIAFGIIASCIGIYTLWQGHRTWKMWQKHRCRVKVSSGLSPAAHLDVSLMRVTDVELETREPEASIKPEASCPATPHSLAGAPESRLFGFWSFENAPCRPSQDVESIESISPLELPESDFYASTLNKLGYRSSVPGRSTTSVASRFAAHCLELQQVPPSLTESLVNQPPPVRLAPLDRISCPQIECPQPRPTNH